MSAFRGPPLEQLFSIPAEPAIDASDKEVVLVRYEKTSCAVDIRRDETVQCIVLKCRKHLRLSDEEYQLCEVKSDGRKQLASPGHLFHFISSVYKCGCMNIYKYAFQVVGYIGLVIFKLNCNTMLACIYKHSLLLSYETVAGKVVLKHDKVSITSKLSANGRLFLFPVSSAEIRKVVCVPNKQVYNNIMLPGC